MISMFIGAFIGFMLGFIACTILREQHEIVEDAITRTMDTNRELFGEYPETESQEWVEQNTIDDVEARR